MSQVRSFEIRVPDSVLDDLRNRLGRTRPARGAITGWSAGTDPGYLASFIASWTADYRWRDTEPVLNALPQMLVSVAGVDIHVFHIRARVPAAGGPAVPLVLTHGWPSSFFEFLPLIGPLTDPATHGADPADAFDIVIPSLPGFGFSGPLPAGQNHPARIADLWAELMGQLGYQRFGAYGGDIGSHVTNFLSARHPGRLIGMFTHHPQLHPRLDGGRPLSVAEQRYLEQRAARAGHDDSYAATQSARPNSLAPGLADSPAGLAAWILDKYRDWSDCHGDLETAIDRPTLLDILTLYWVTNSIGTSFLHYADDAQTPPLPPVTVPAGLTLTPEDAGYPRQFAERTYADIRLWRGPEPGGHFLALEQPARLARDLRDFYRPLRATP
ncbi:MAG: epoxide hydrolase family protein [Streptosporangiaceae bacterium]